VRGSLEILWWRWSEIMLMELGWNVSRTAVTFLIG